MVKLPIYEQQVQPDTQVIPSVPKNTGNPGLVLSSMNKNAEAVQNAASTLGDVGQKLYAHAQKLQTLQLKKKNAELDTQFRQELQDKLYSPDEETVTVNGQDITRPKGIYNRSLKQAEGSRAEFEDYYATTRQKYLSQVSDPDAQLALANSLDNQYFSARDNVISHEAKQMREDLVNGFKSNISQQIKDAANSTDLKSLTESVNNAVDTQKSLNDALGLDSATAKLAEQKTIADVIESSTSAALMKDMSGSTSMKLLDAAKGVLDQKDYEELASGIKIKSKRIIEDTKASVKLAKHINSTKVLMDVANGNFNVFNAKELNRMANNGEISNEAATAAIRAIEKPITEYDLNEKPDDYAFMERAKGIFQSENPEDMERNLIDVLDGFSSGNLSQDRMTLLFQAAKAQGSEKANAFRENFKKIYDWGVDAGVPVTYQSQVTKDYIEGLNAGKDPVEAAEVAIKRATAAQNESVSQDLTEYSTDPKENIGFADRLLTTPAMNTLFEGIQKFSQNRAIKNMGLAQAGLVEGVGGAAQMVGLKDFGAAVSKEAIKMQETFKIDNPNFWDSLQQGGWLSLGFLAPGLGIAKAATLLKAAPIIAVGLGISGSSLMESALEGGNNRAEAKRRGLSDKEANMVGDVTFWLNLIPTFGGNIAGGVFNPAAQTVKKMTVKEIIKEVVMGGKRAAAAEGAQEGLQQVASNVAIGDPIGQGVREAALIGAIIGKAMGVATSDVFNQTKAMKNDASVDNTVKDKTGKPLSFNVEPGVENEVKVDPAIEKISNDIAVKKAVIAQAISGVETIENGGNSKEVALNSAIASNLEIISGVNNPEVKIEAAKSIDKAVYQYFLQSGMSKNEAATISKQIYDASFSQKTAEGYKQALIESLQAAIPTWRFTAPDILTVSESQDSLKKTIAEGEKIVKDGGINGKSLPSEDLNIIDQSVTDAKKTVQGGDLNGKSQEGQNGQEKDVLIPQVQEATPNAPVSPLHAEALKYKTADEFVKAQTNVFHGTKAKFSPESIKPEKGTQGTGIYLSLNKDIATKYAKGGEVIEYAGKDLKLAETSKFTKEQSAQFSSAYEKSVKELGEHSDEATNQAYKSMGFDGKKITDTEIMLFDNSKIKTKSQLTAIYNEAHGKNTPSASATPETAPKRVMPTGEVKKSAAYQRALERYSEELKGQPEAQYTTVNIADQMARAVKFVDENPKLARKIAYGMEPAPSGLRESAVSIAYNEKMYQDGNMSEFGKSYRSRSLRQTTRGQEIVLEKAAQVNQNHPLYFARQVIEARTAQIGKKLFEINKDSKTDAPVKRALKKMNEKTESLKKEIVDSKTLDITEAQKIIDSLIC